MNVSRRALFTCLFAVVAVAAGCGGTETGGTAATDAAARGGGATTTAVVMAAAPDPADRNANFTISVYPGSYASQQLIVKWQCYQNGQMRAYDGSYDLNAAVSQGLPGYTWNGDHFEWTFVVSQIPYNENLVAGPATCNMQTYYQNRKLQWIQVGSGTFGVQ
jgi:hypothetical protein